MSRAVSAVVVLLFCCSSLAQAASCSSFFDAGRPPQLLDHVLADRSHEICYSYYAVDASGLTRTPLWAAERLSTASVTAARDMKRRNAFHEDPNVDSQDEASLRDYLHSGYDRGHNVPSGDAPDAQAQYETFSLLNMSPQNADNNRHLWEGIESTVRDLAERNEAVFAVTGPAFIGPATFIGGRVEVPTHLWKAIYVPGQGAAAYITKNASGSDYAIVSISQLRQITHIDPFPSLAEPMREHAMPLPAPNLRSHRKAHQVELTDLGVSGVSTVVAGTRTRDWMATISQGKVADAARRSVQRALHRLGVDR